MFPYICDVPVYVCMPVCNMHVCNVHVCITHVCMQIVYWHTHTTLIKVKNVVVCLVLIFFTVMNIEMLSEKLKGGYI